MAHPSTEAQTATQFANPHLSTFFYHISHDLRAPLASILGLTNLALQHEKKNAEDLIIYFSMIEQSVKKLDKKLTVLLDYSRNARSSEIIVEDVDLSKLLHDGFNEMKYIEGHSNIEFNVEINTDQPFFSDIHRISTILENLISNAIKYSDASKEKSFIHVACRITSEQVVITFHDNGIGIAHDQLDKVFNMFYRATTSSSGSGLGLYLVGEMMEKLNGNIEITSTFHEETIITLTIPNSPPPVAALLKNHFKQE